MGKEDSVTVVFPEMKVEKMLIIEQTIRIEQICPFASMTRPLSECYLRLN